MTIREHRGEMEHKIIKLEASLEKAGLQIREYSKQVSVENLLNWGALKNIKLHLMRAQMEDRQLA